MRLRQAPQISDEGKCEYTNEPFVPEGLMLEKLKLFIMFSRTLQGL